MLNHEVVTSVSTQVTEEAKLSIRGKGRYILDRIGPVTKKKDGSALPAENIFDWEASYMLTLNDIINVSFRKVTVLRV